MEDKIFSLTDQEFEPIALDIFQFQYHQNPIYHSWVDTLGVDPSSVRSIRQIPFLPINFFKTHKVVSTDFEPVTIFESSGTSGLTNSRHFIRNLDIYRKSYLKTFQQFYGEPMKYAILGLLPSYLERKNSSLVMMADELIRMSKHQSSGFYLYDYDKLREVLMRLDESGQPVLLLGVTFGLLDFAEKNSMRLKHVTVMETGGMKGRREELTREAVHEILKEKLGIASVHSEYGMTELLSQAYSKAAGFFHAPPWMKILIRDEEDPLQLRAFSNSQPLKGVLNIIDLANLYSCSFIASDDVGCLYPNGSFTVDGRLDQSDLRGCSLLYL